MENKTVQRQDRALSARVTERDGHIRPLSAREAVEADEFHRDSATVRRLESESKMLRRAKQND